MDEDIGPNLSFSAHSGRHRLRLNLGSQYVRPGEPTDIALDNYTASFAYGYQFEAHEAGVEIDYGERRPESARNTEHTRFGLSYRYHFGWETRRAAPRVATAATRPAPASAALNVSDLYTGMPIDDAFAHLTARGIQGGVLAGSATVFEYRLFRGETARQRLALMSEGATLVKAVVLVDLPFGNGERSAALYKRLRAELIKRYGQPARAEEGGLGADLFERLARGEVPALTEWRTANGVLRLGIPQLSHGARRIEIHHAASLPSVNETRWGLEEVL